MLSRGLAGLLALCFLGPGGVAAGDPKTALERDRRFDRGSGIVATTLSDRQVENLVLLGKIWGFLKYHHPRIAGGERHWDYDLFRVMPAVLDAPTAETASEAIVDWVRDLGSAGPCDPCAEPPKNFHLLPRLDWIRDTELLGPLLSGYLFEIHLHRFAGPEQFYVIPTVGIGNPLFLNEPTYEERAYPDPGYRLLVLFRFWNIIEYWFPYRDLIEEDWDGVLREFLPRLAGAEDERACRLELIALIARVHDTHANLWSNLDDRPPVGACRIPVIVRFVEDRAVITHLLGTVEGAEVGDVVLAIDGVSVASMVADREPYYAASNRPTRLRDIGWQLPRGACGKVPLEIERAGERRELSVKRVPSERLNLEPYRIHDLPGPTFRLLSPEVAYLKLSDIRAMDVARYLKGASKTKGLVVDIRNYPSEFVVFELGQRLVRKPTPFARFTVADISNPGAFVWGPQVTLKPRGTSFRGKVVILVDEISQSQAEYTAMALRAGPQTTVVGSTTAGADGNLSRIPLPGGERAAISGIGVFYPDKSSTQRVGIVPDVTVRPTIVGIREGRDEVLERAARVILGDDVDEDVIRAVAKPDPIPEE